MWACVGLWYASRKPGADSGPGAVDRPGSRELNSTGCDEGAEKKTPQTSSAEPKTPSTKNVQKDESSENQVK